ncbi:Sap-like sulfolipid-1-addressing protein [Glaciihabitans tibetensis]|uniref:Sap-like sulfolipid-1-addressing protein n=1 Tax=Glaciihabitans tibetensis TaxID=1266600 RepID=A0A2T0VB00_9MICO|nr:GAP family protein [Glaciihabitans tibetensis]PRY67248.1 Sap-like sulfolipid-1-addressing protein [Glaciihabitans tibetensis]
MGPVIGEILPLAVGVAISPIPIIAAILMLLAPKARATSVGFLIGWCAGILVVTTAFVLLSAVIPATDSSDERPVVGTIKIVLGALLLLVAARQWRTRPRGSEKPALPRWMSAIATMTVARGLALGFVLAAVNPKNLLLSASAGIAIGTAGLSTGYEFLSIAVFAVAAASTVAVPVIAYFAAASRMRGPLENLRVWLERNNHTVMSVLLLVIGVVVIGQGIAEFGA